MYRGQNAVFFNQRGHAADWILLPQNVETEHGIDETSLQGELYTILHNKEGHGRKGSIVAVVKGTNPAEREAVTKLNKEKAEFRKRLERLASQRKAYRDRMIKKHGNKWRRSKRGKKPQRLNTRFVPSRLANGETLIEALTRCSKQLCMSRDKWSKSQEARAKILFAMYPKQKEAYSLINSLRAIFRDKNLDKETAKPKLKQWYEKVAACTLREVKSVRDTIQFYEDEILNYFIKRQTNASSESLNSKIKCFRNEGKGVLDMPFFMYRLATVFG